jgi:Tol biopolymer transport system component
MSLNSIFKTLSIVLLVLTISSSAEAQYFGRNKPRYRKFDFKVLETPNYDFYYYSKNKAAVEQFAKWSEMWYDYHKEIVGEEFSKQNPVILYNSHGDFQQTNSIQGDIGVGTGGVTEAFKNRVVMPFTFSNQATYQVLGHELVHAFQFNSILNGDSTNIQSLGNLDLLLVEGMAEYMTLGRVDPFTSMWMRDAIINNKVPTIKQMRNPRYFPYRYGQAFWSVLTGTYGDQVIKPYFKATAIYGLELATQLLFEMSLDNLSSIWVNGLTNHYTPYLRDKIEKPQGNRLFSTENSGNLNVSPSLSPNGRYMVFLSEKDLFTTDLYLADVRTGKVLNKVSSLIKDGDLDNLDFLESSGTWSPNGKDFAFVAYKKGKNVIVIKDADAGKTVNMITLPTLDAVANPAWSPDGKKMILSGMKEGQTDLYSLDIKSGRVTQLTNDLYSEIMPNFNADGSKLAFCYDKRTMTEGRKNGHITYDIAILDVASNSITTLDVFHGSENINPSYDHEGNIYFVSERDGFRNMYKYVTATQTVLQMTDLLTGITGISRYSPCISVSNKKDQVVYTHYMKGGYEIYEVNAKEMLNKPVDAKIIEQTAGTLPVLGLKQLDVVNKNLREADTYPFVSSDEFKNKAYRPKFALDYVGGGTGIGVGNNSFGTQSALQGGIDMIFSDIIGNNQMFGQMSVNGEIFDIGGQWTYINRSNRLAWGASLSHVPIRTGYQDFLQENIRFSDGVTRQVLNNQLNILRIFDQNLGAFVQYPFSTTKRFEAGGGFMNRSFRYDQYNNYYIPNFNQWQFVGEDREKIEVPDTLALNQYYKLVKGQGASVSAAFVGDNSFFGLTAPLAGYRYRVGVDKYWGADDFISVTLDGRNYLRKNKFTFATRFTSNVRFENRVNSVFPYYVGQMGFVRGYGTILNNQFISQLGDDYGQLLGSKIAVASAEIRLPFLGPKRLALIPFNFLPTDLNIFFDAGVAFDRFSHFTDGERLLVFEYGPDGLPLRDRDGKPISSEQFVKPTIARTAGISARVNLFGYFIIEPYYAWQLRSNGGGGTFGFNLTPGW